MKMPDSLYSSLFAVCGVNCAFCEAHLREKDRCSGCLSDPKTITRKSCRQCAKKECAKAKGYTHCFECGKYPCSRIKPLEKRYNQNYRISLVENSRIAKEEGIDALMREQRAAFLCDCGGAISEHTGVCNECGKERGIL